MGVGQWKGTPNARLQTAQTPKYVTWYRDRRQVLYTGPMYQVYNTVLRQYPPDVFVTFSGGGNLFPATIHALGSAVVKVFPPPRRFPPCRYRKLMVENLHHGLHLVSRKSFRPLKSSPHLF